jgi:hypothetical protein
LAIHASAPRFLVAETEITAEPTRKHSSQGIGEGSAEFFFKKKGLKKIKFEKRWWLGEK